MTRSWIAIPTLLFAMTACAKSHADDALHADLDMAASNGMELAPSVGQAKVISSVERAPYAPPAPAHNKRVPVPRAVADPDAPTVGLVQAPAPSEQPTIVDSTPVSTPRPQPRGGSSGNGRGYKSVGEVIRDAPFPINP